MKGSARKENRLNEAFSLDLVPDFAIFLLVIFIDVAREGMMSDEVADDGLQGCARQRTGWRS